MDILIRGVPSSKLFEVPSIVDYYFKAYPCQPLGFYHAAFIGVGKMPDWKAEYAVYKVKSGIVVKWVADEP